MRQGNPRLPDHRRLEAIAFLAVHACSSKPRGLASRVLQAAGCMDARGERERLLQRAASARAERVHDERESVGTLNGVPDSSCIPLCRISHGAQPQPARWWQDSRLSSTRDCAARSALYRAVWNIAQMRASPGANVVSHGADMRESGRRCGGVERASARSTPTCKQSPSRLCRCDAAVPAQMCASPGADVAAFSCLHKPPAHAPATRKGRFRCRADPECRGLPPKARPPPAHVSHATAVQYHLGLLMLGSGRHSLAIHARKYGCGGGSAAHHIHVPIDAHRRASLPRHAHVRQSPAWPRHSPPMCVHRPATPRRCVYISALFKSERPSDPPITYTFPSMHTTAHPPSPRSCPAKPAAPPTRRPLETLFR
jgi:hypothetical protein